MKIRNLRIGQKLVLANLVPLVVILFITVLTVFWFKTNLLEERKLKTRHLVETAHGLLDHYHQLEKQGVLSAENAKKSALDAIKSLRYEGSEYFWIHDLGAPIPKMVMHPTVPSLDGKVLDLANFNRATSMQLGSDGEVEATDGKMNLFVAMNSVANRQGHGYVVYMWPKPKQGGKVTEELFPKISYAKKFSTWGWVIGSGIYIDDLDAFFQKQLIIAATVVLLLCVLLFAISTVIARWTVRPLSELQNFCSEVERTHDFTLKALPHGSDEVGQTTESVLRLLSALRATFGNILGSVGRVDEASRTLITASRDTARNSALASDSASDMAASVEELSVGINQISDSANEAAVLSREAGARSQEGGKTILDATNEMNAIADKVRGTSSAITALGEESRQISGIVSVIKGVAEQTNLLALNAAIEAARAGEAGRGFAVVADEVRKLAERTTLATAEIASVTGSIQQRADQAVNAMSEAVAQVERGAALATQAGSAINDIRSGSERVVAIVRQITDSLAESSSASQNMANQTEKVAQVAEESNHAAQQSLQSAENLEILTREVRETVGKFKI